MAQPLVEKGIAKRAVRNRVYTGETHLRGLKTFDFLLVHGGGLPFGNAKGERLYSRDF
ncbi:hypothetical protein [Nostoc sp. NOS(2021)]|uniref:hypothetical protein n=1 Tax=Nostoc sp. NOS(2021) TaxID=2815407 RepID=UPI0025D613C0|nr:hypothetical protein [Nostoc sp. NOS(2021)]